MLEIQRRATNGEILKDTYYFSTHGAGGFFLVDDFTPDEEGLSAADIFPVFRKACIIKFVKRNKKERNWKNSIKTAPSQVEPNKR